MGELRFILLAAGALLIGGLWWWELRRGSRARRASRDLSAARQEPVIEALPALEPLEDGEDDELPTLRTVPEGRPVPGPAPPVVTIDDLPEDTDRVVLASNDDRAARPRAAPRPAPASIGAAARAAPVAQAGGAAPAHVASEIAVAPHPPPHPAAPATSSAPGGEPNAYQKIAAIRLLATSPDQIAGGELRAALEGEGLLYGRYSIYHRQRADGRMLYSVASLREPGSFELEKMAAQRYPGLSVFAVFPGTAPAPDVFDDMLALARRLAERLGCVLQDDRGGSLTPQRVQSLREDLVQFEHTIALVRARSTG
jgi:cell division protein ZipA